MGVAGHRADGTIYVGSDDYKFYAIGPEPEVRGVVVPLVTPLGLVALIGLLSIVALSTLERRKKR